MEFKNNELGILENELYSISLQLSLYINAGLVTSLALSKLSSDYGKRNTPGARLLKYVQRQSEEKNMAFESILFDEARKIKSKTLMRISILLLENKSKGSEVSEKLEGERIRLRNSRINSAKAKAKRAETKLCFPLMLLLVALVALCVAPAILNM